MSSMTTLERPRRLRASSDEADDRSAMIASVAFSASLIVPLESTLGHAFAMVMFGLGIGTSLLSGFLVEVARASLAIWAQLERVRARSAGALQDARELIAENRPRQLEGRTSLAATCRCPRSTVWRRRGASSQRCRGRVCSC